MEIKKAEPKKPNPPPAPSRRYADSRPGFAGGFADAYSGFGSSSFGNGPYRSGGSYNGRVSAYGGYGGSEFGGYGGIGPYREPPSFGYSGRYGGGFNRGYDLGGGHGGPSDGYGGYGAGPGSGYGGSYDAGIGGTYGGSTSGSFYGSRGAGYGGGGSSGRYHPYGR